jgi:hypothetical protein
VQVLVNGASVPRMVVTDRTLFVSDLAADHTITPLLTTGNTASSLDIIVGNDGYILTPDDATMEVADDLYSLAIDGYIDTSAGANKYIFYKNGALNVENDAAGQLTADFNGNTIIDPAVASGEHDIEIGRTRALYLGDGVPGAYVRVPDNPVFDFGSNDYTISMWVNFRANNTYLGLFSRNQSWPDEAIFYRPDGLGAFELQWFISYPMTPYIMDRSATFTPDLNRWYNLMFIRSGNDFEIYIDGVVAGVTETEVIAVPDATETLRVGYVDFFTDDYSYCKWQEVRILERALTVGEIADYQTCTYTDNSDLELYLKCNESSGTAVYDYSPNFLDSVVIGGAGTYSRNEGGLWHYLEVDGVESGRVIDTLGIPDNANDWYFMQNNSVSYADDIIMWAGGSLVLLYAPYSMLTAIINPASPYAVGTATFTTGTSTVTGAGGAAWTRDMIGGQIKCDGDAVYYKIVDVPAATTITLNTEYLEAGGAGEAYTIDTFNLTATLDDYSTSFNDGTITFGANPLGVVTGIGALTSYSSTTITPTVPPDMANVESNQGDLISTPYPNPTLSNNLLTPWFTPWSQLTNIPLVAFFLILGTVILIVIVVWIMKRTNNQLIASFVLIAGEAILWKLGIYELWPVIVTSIICFAIIVWERKPSI